MEEEESSKIEELNSQESGFILNEKQSSENETKKDVCEVIEF